jgi:hypothetical protein
MPFAAGMPVGNGHQKGAKKLPEVGKNPQKEAG